MKTRTAALALPILPLSPGLAAHPGGHDAEGLAWHLLTQPDHLALLLGVLVAVGLLLARRAAHEERDR